MGLGHRYVTQHAIERVRRRWPEAASLHRGALIKLVASSVDKAEKEKKLLNTPSGTYVPFSIGDKDGYLVVRRNRVVTALEEKYCPEVSAIMKERK